MTETQQLTVLNRSLDRRRILGYTNKLTVRPSEKIEFKISAETESSCNAQLVKLINGDVQSTAANFKEFEIPSPINGNYSIRHQPIHMGSCIIINEHPILDTLDEFTLAVTFMPTTPTLGKQHLISRWNECIKSGWSLYLNEHGQLTFSCTDFQNKSSSVTVKKVLISKQWYQAVVRISGILQTMRLDIIPLAITPIQKMRLQNSYATTKMLCELTTISTPLIMAAAYGGYDSIGRVIPKNCFNGLLESPVLYRGLLSDSDVSNVLVGNRPIKLSEDLIADWDFSKGIGSIEIKDCSPNWINGSTHNLPLRAIKGSRWDGSVMEWSQAPEQYAAIHFHNDDLYDCGWLTDITYKVDDDLPSGIYALRIRQEQHEDYLPFFVAAPKETAKSKAAFIVPTYTYMAYGNVHCLEVLRKKEGMAKEEFYATTSAFGPGSEHAACLVEAHYEVGLSTYDRHSDGSPVHFSSWLRPLLTMRPKTFLWNLGADLLFIDWLESKGFEYDIITDDLLQEEGVSLLRNYEVLMTGNHPEYPTTQQLDAIQAYLDQGGRVMYLGGNGYYWRSAIHKTLPGVMEVRRGRSGTASWSSDVGEFFLEFTGEAGGLWRDIGRPPQQLFGVGFISPVGDSSYFRVCPRVRSSRASFILKDVDKDIIGDFGILGGGAAGQEIDRTNFAYGTPTHTIVVARSEMHGSNVNHAIEERALDCLATEEFLKNETYAEVVFFETPKGGAVFSVGSMAWFGCLSSDNYQNNISTITANVLTRFCDATPFDLAEISC